MKVIFTKNGIVFGVGIKALVISINRKQAQKAYNKYLAQFNAE